MDAIAALLGQIQPWHWLALGLAFLVAELASGSTYLLWPAASAWLVGLLLFFLPIGVGGQLLIFAGATIALTLTGHRYVRGRWLTQGGDPQLMEPGLRFRGRQAVAAGPFEHGVGRVRLDDTEWRAESLDAIGAGEKVEVLAVEGATLKVRRLG